jgi:hypothetical protein
LTMLSMYVCVLHLWLPLRSFIHSLTCVLDLVYVRTAS